MDATVKGQGPKAINIAFTNVTANPISRHEILSWINNTIEGMEVLKVEDLCTGVAYCRLMDHLFGSGTVNLKRVKIDAKLENDFIMNFKVLQVAFNNLGVDRAIPIQKLAKGRYQDNYDYAQWFKMFFDANYVYRPKIERSTRPESAKTLERSLPVKAQKSPRTPSKSSSRPPTAPIIPVMGDSTTAAYVCMSPPESPTANMPAIGSILTKLSELTTEIHALQDAIKASAFDRSFFETKIEEIFNLCSEEDKKPVQSPEMAALLHRVFRVIKREEQPGTTVGTYKAIMTTAKALPLPDEPFTGFRPLQKAQVQVDSPQPKSEDDDFTDSESEDDYDAAVPPAVAGLVTPFKRYHQKALPKLVTIHEEASPCGGDMSLEVVSDGDLEDY